MNQTKKNSVQIIIGLLLIAGLIYLGNTLDIGSRIDQLTQWIEDFGMGAPFIFIGIYIVTAGYVVPVIFMTVMGGVLFGVTQGSVYVSIAFCLSSILVYSIGRVYGEKLIPAKLQSSDKFHAVCRVLKEDGLKFVFLMRFVPIVSSIVLNLTSGMIKIRVRDFMWGTFLGQLPGTLLYTYSGSITRDVVSATEGSDKSMQDWIMLGVGLTVTIIVFVMISVKAKKAMAEAGA